MSTKYKNKYRIVTLDGDVINSWGSISGGYKSNKNSFSLIGRKQQLDDAQYEINSLEISLKENTKKIDTLVNNLKKTREKLLLINSDKESNNLKIDDVQKVIYKNEIYISNILKRIEEINGYNENHQVFNSEKENKLQLLTNNSIIINDNINLVNLEISDIKNKISELEKNEIFILNNLDTVERDLNILNNSKSILLENKVLIERKLNLKENELESSKSQLITNLSEIELIESLIIEFDSKINELTNSIN